MVADFKRLFNWYNHSTTTLPRRYSTVNYFRRVARNRLGVFSWHQIAQTSHRLPNFQRGSAKPGEQLLAAGQNNDLHFVASPHQYVEHAFNTFVVGKSERIVENNRC